VSLADVVVVGGGPSGLAAGFRLRKAGARVRVLEMSDRVGGKMRTTARDGFLVDQGAFFLPTSHRTLLRLAGEAGMRDKIVPGGFVLATARNGELHNIDGHHPLRSLLGTRLISARTKLEATKLISEIIKSRRAVFDTMPSCGAYDSETLAEWARDRFSPDMREILLDGTLRGIFATSAATSPRVDFLAILALLRGASLVAFEGGMGSCPAQLAEGLDVQLGAEVLSVEPAKGGVSLVWRNEDGEHRERAAACVIAVPAIAARRILPGMDPWRRQFLERVRHGRTFVLNIGLGRPPPNVASTYIQVPRVSHPFVTGIMLDHHKAPGRAPNGKGLLSVAVLDSWCDEHWLEDDAVIREALLRAVDGLLPATLSHTEFVELHRWFQEYNQVGFYRQLGEFRARCEADDRIQLAGDFHSMQNLEAATISGLRAAERLLFKRVLT
jgi:oxygen-dependent protoporphyrinogen oxidase